MKSVGNEGVIQSRLQVLHVHVFLAAPLGARHMAKSGADQHQGRVAIGECPHHPRPSADLTVQPLDHVVGADARPVLAGKSAVAGANQNFKCFSSQILVPAPVCAFANVAFAICTFFRHLVLLFRRMADVIFFLPLEGVEPICLQLFRHAPRQLEASREAHQL